VEGHAAARTYAGEDGALAVGPLASNHATITGVASRIGEIIIDCHDPEAAAAFWCTALGYRVTVLAYR
jgi:hypothetical protein